MQFRALHAADSKLSLAAQKQALQTVAASSASSAVGTSECMCVPAQAAVAKLSVAVQAGLSEDSKLAEMCQAKLRYNASICILFGASVFRGR